MLDQQLISRLFTRPYNPFPSYHDIITKSIRSMFDLRKCSIEYVHKVTFAIYPSMSESTFYLCYQSAVMSI